MSPSLCREGVLAGRVACHSLFTVDQETRHSAPDAAKGEQDEVAVLGTDDNIVVPRVEEEREQFGHQLELEEQKGLERSVVEMAVSRIEDVDGLYVGGLWALRRSDSLLERGITHVLSMVSFNPAGLKNFKNEPFAEYGKPFKHLLIDIDDVDDEDILIHMPRAVGFIDEGMSKRNGDAATTTLEKGVGNLDLGHDAGKSRSVSMVVAYLLWRYPNRFDPGSSSPATKRPRRETAPEAVLAALRLIRRTRPMAEPNEGFMQQLALWWEWGCPEDMEGHPAYQRWAYQREVKESVDVGQAPSRLRFEDEFAQPAESSGRAASGVSLRCKKCRRTLATAPFILQHEPLPSSSPSLESSPTATATLPAAPAAPTACQHIFVEPLSWMRTELEKGEMSGRLSCPHARCGAGVGRYDWKGFRCTCGEWVTPGFSLQRARVDEEVRRAAPAVMSGGGARAARNLGIRMPPGARGRESMKANRRLRERKEN
ncbi:Tyrosine-protein phosphatase YVH1-like protein [Cladobotryum mycophilum]|uniref:protein-tyrosine-phosphatase n=1 Tax=Cladobotryum mycophilum TaxID=491253 RepID=A0ABR0SBE2_9HYPO